MKVVARNGLLVVSVALTAFIVGTMVWFARFGLDLTDEGYYLNWISHPGQYPASPSQFGFVYHPLYRLLGGDIVLLRRVNILLLFGLAWTASARLLLTWLRLSRPVSIVCGAAVACASMVAFHVNLVTPSYNSLAIQGVLVVVIGLLMASRDLGWRSVAGWVLIGVGGWLVFMAKPTAAAALAVVVVVYVLMSRMARVRLLLIAAGTAVVLLIVSALLIDQSIVGFVQRLSQGADLLSTLGAGHEIGEVLRWDRLELDGDPRTVFALVPVVVLLAGLAVGLRPRLWAVLCAIGAIVGVWVMWRLTEADPAILESREPYRKALFFTLPIAAAALGVILGKSRALRSVPRAHWVLAACLLVLPHATAFGTNLNYWQQAGMLAVCWVMAALVLLSPLAGGPRLVWIVLVFGFATQALAWVLAAPTLEHPYRQADPLPGYSARVQVGPAATSLRVMDDAAKFLEETKKVFDENGLSDGHPVIDLTGQSPGVIWSAGALAADHPWAIGGYDGSAEHTRVALSRLSCAQLAVTWILTEPGGPRAIPSHVVSVFGATFDTDFEPAAEWDAPKIGRRPWDIERGMLVLMRPTRTPAEARAACETIREEAP